ncbi:unnamed protein product [Schistocephalus solidus]|uniref:Uncharacterized protein n=1 Tax=Schistocephalus solidus TaxID=70667 RepID=A0A183SN08_SCHSO|nr:unnamed protein product [Schistocephalus solidus]
MWTFTNATNNVFANPAEPHDDHHPPSLVIAVNDAAPFITGTILHPATPASITSATTTGTTFHTPTIDETTFYPPPATSSNTAPLIATIHVTSQLYANSVLHL